MTKTIKLTRSEWKFLRDLMSAASGHIPDELEPINRRRQMFEIKYANSILRKLMERKS